MHAPSLCWGGSYQLLMKLSFAVKEDRNARPIHTERFITHSGLGLH